MYSSGDIQGVGTWLMAGGGILAAFGIVAYMLSKSAGDRGGLSHLMAIVGVCLFFLGMFLNSRYGSYY